MNWSKIFPIHTNEQHTTGLIETAKEYRSMVAALNRDNHLFTEEIKRLQTLIQTNADEKRSLAAQLKTAQDELLVIELKNTPHRLETYWNNKRPVTNNFKYSCRTIHGMNQNMLYAIDPRIFLQARGSTIPTFTGSHDEIALKAQAWVMKNITYTPDKDPVEYWYLPLESTISKRGDCDDGSIIMASIMLESGIPAWKIRVNCGTVKASPTAPTGGHAFVTYLREDSTPQGTWYVLDWCFYPNESKDFKLPWKKAEGKYFDIWWSFTESNIYAKEMLDR